ncbi:MAG: dihydroorotase [Alphaproteobacteria bacterium]
MRQFLYNARVIDPAQNLDMMGGMLIENGRIYAIDAKFTHKNAVRSAAQTIDCMGHILSPGLIDGRVHCREPGEEHKESFASASSAALSGGITSFLQRPDTTPEIDGVSMVERVANLGKIKNSVRIFPIAALSQGLKGEKLTQFGLLQNAGAVGFSDADRPIKSTKLLRRALSYAAAFDALVIDLPQDQEFTDGGTMNAGALATRLGLSGIPAFAEHLQVTRDLNLLESVPNAKLHLSLITTRKAIDAIRTAKAQGLDVSCDTAPHYFRMNEGDIGDYRSFAKTFPPLRCEDDRNAVIEGLADGTIDMVVSDHNPQDQESKRLPIEQAEFGVIGLQTLLPSILHLVHDYNFSLVQALKLVTLTPAMRYGLNGGQLTKGAPADLILINPDKGWKVKEHQLRSKSKNTAFEGQLMQGEIVWSMVDGQTLYNAR